ECDLLVLPSQSETFGVVLIEALASGKPVVATRCGGPEGIVMDSTLGALCAPNDAQALADMLLETIARLPTFEPARIRQLAARRFDYRRVTEHLANEYSEIAGEPTRHAA